jgi:lipopolysaccharide export system permease protein
VNKLTRYIATDYLVTFLMTILVFTFVMCIGTVLKAIDLMSRGVSFWIFLQIFAANIPYILSFTIPMSCMTTVLLVFSRLSLDGEITAMKASGLTMWQIISAPVMISILLTGFCIYLHSYAAPESHFKNRRILREVGVEEPVNLLEEGRFVRDFPGLIIWVGKKKGGTVEDIVVYETEGGTVRTIRARRGTISSDEENRVLLVDLYDVRIDQPNPVDPMDISKVRQINAKHYPVRLDFSRIWHDGTVTKRVPDMTMTELIAAIRNLRATFPQLTEEDLLRQKMKMVQSANERLALSLACFAFTILGVPLGMKSRRKESSIGILVSLGVVFGFYLFIIVADALVYQPHLHPDMIIWIPVVLAEVFGFTLIHKLN